MFRNIFSACVLPVGIGKVVHIQHMELVLFHLTNGQVRAIENKSPHPKGGRLSDGLVSGEFLYCPLYDWKISLIDGQVQAPDNGVVQVYEVHIDDDSVYIYF
ncbi:nitrite reductase (NAD(P)H) small subunit [Halalkalibacter urbisdiaboli]|uniref:nitrite reductase (NAD(P)H) small subunit n=1 Tax=Halalkalibacter urbisdiaboli TaxID=1960589 RepID=UPI000B441511|nr:nitrite reductase (NAD(P)H) small subunit [Halalkalibacter urbisdiaboli]